MNQASKNNQKISTEPYKGVRDFYPIDKFIHNYILDTLSAVCESFGYENYDASVLEPTQLYTAKNSQSEEIVNEQTYSFTDRGGRSVTLRPEMTPTVARMIAKKHREISFPARWYSIPNVFRYERPQKGRLREHWQLNADIFGVEGIEAEVESILLAHTIMTQFGANETDFEIRINDRQLIESIFAELNLSFDQAQNTMRIMDKKSKMTYDDFQKVLREYLGAKTDEFIKKLENAHSNVRLEELLFRLDQLGVHNVVVDLGTVRGFNYYTGIVFEVFDTDKKALRSMFGGGRYDNLTEMFGVKNICGFGFGMGDVTMRDFLESHNLLPEYHPPTDIMICLVDKKYANKAQNLAQMLRKNYVNTIVNISGKKLGDQIKTASKSGIPFIIPFGPKEEYGGKIKIKHLASGDEKEINVDDIPEYIIAHTD